MYVWSIPNAQKRMDRQENKDTGLTLSIWDLSPDKPLYLQSGSWEPPFDSQQPTVGKGRSWRTPHADLLGRSDSVLCSCTAGILWCGSFPVSCSPQKSGSLCSWSCLETQKATVVSQLIKASEPYQILTDQQTGLKLWIFCGYSGYLQLNFNLLLLFASKLAWHVINWWC